MSKASPLESLHRQLNAEFGEYCGWELPRCYGDVQTEINGLHESCAAFDLSSFGRIEIKGAGCGEFVNKLLANDIAGLEEGKWSKGIVCDEGGKIVDFVRIARKGNSYLLLTRPAGRAAVIEVCKICKDKFGLSVEIVDQTEKTAMVAVYGPRAVDAMNNIIPLELSDIEKGCFKSFSLFMMSIMVIRGGWLGEDGLELICPASAAKFAGGAIEKYHKKENVVPGGMDCMEAEMNKQYAFSGLSELPAERLSPQECGVMREIDLSKDFFGKSSLG